MGIRLLIHKEGDLNGNEWKNEYMFNDGKGYKSSNQGKGIPGRIGVTYTGSMRPGSQKQ
jgi:hypothetical protein